MRWRLVRADGCDWFVGILLWAGREVKPPCGWHAAGSADKGTRRGGEAFLLGGGIADESRELTVRSLGPLWGSKMSRQHMKPQVPGPVTHISE